MLMKKYTLILVLILSSLINAQVALPFDFEDGENPFTSNNSVGTVIEDPTDASNKVLQVEGQSGTWDNIIAYLELNVNLSDNNNNTITFRIKPINGTGSGNHLLKFEGEADTGPNQELAFTTTGTDWQDISLDFPSSLGNYSDLVIFTDANSAATDVYLIDDIAGATNSSPPVDEAPTVAAPSPPERNSWDVISLFSDVYTDITDTEWSATWDDSDISDLEIVGDNVKKVQFVNFLGVILSDYYDLTNFTYLHIDVWTATATANKSFIHKFSNHAASAGETSAIQFVTNNASTPVLPESNPGNWMSYDIPFSSFTAAAANGVIDREAIKEFIITSDLGIVYLDNIYVYRDATASLDTHNLFNISLSPSPALNDLKISAQENIDNIIIYNLLGKKVFKTNINKKEEVIDVSNLNSGIYILKYTINKAVGTIKFIKE